jgi:uncharacterized protein
MNSFRTRQLLSVLCHGSLYGSPFILPIAFPLIIWLTHKDALVKENAKEAINFFLNYLAFSLITSPLTVMLMTENIVMPRPLTLLYLGAIFLICLVILILPAVAIIRMLSHPQVSYRYPLIRRPL